MSSQSGFVDSSDSTPTEECTCQEEQRIPKSYTTMVSKALRSLSSRNLLRGLSGRNVLQCSEPEDDPSDNNNNCSSCSDSPSPESSMTMTLQRSTRNTHFWFMSPYIYVPVLLMGAVVQYYGGVNEAMIAGMSLTYYHYGLIHGGPSVYASTEYGRLRGFTSYSREGRPFYEFLGIPYAKPPVGELRFQAPVPPLSWDGVRDATGYGYACTQYDLFLQSVMGEEDCLTLNIYTPTLNSTDGRLLPVLFFIHGGMYHFGRSMDFRGTHFMDLPEDEQVVVVTINYRLQAFGFLNTGDGVVRGNMGLKDQVMALRWVNRNILQFGGDPELVSIWGESAGGASTQFHTLSPMSKGLFHRAISHSGFSLAHWSFIRKPGEQAKLFGRTFGCPTTSSREMVDCLRKISSYRIAEHFRGNHNVLHPRLEVFAPTIESGLPNENDTETFLPAHPRELLRKGKIASKVPMINGANSHEGLIYAGYFVRNETVAKSLNTEWQKHAPVLLDFEDLPSEQRKKVANQIWSKYLGNKSVGMDALYEIVDLFSDVSFFKPMEETSLSFAKHVPLYMYVWSHQGKFGVAQGYFRITMKLPLTLDGVVANFLQSAKERVFGIKEHHYGACHADELSIFLDMHPLLSNIHLGHPEYEFSKEMVRHWAYFAKHGKPLPFRGHEWTRLQPKLPHQYMKIDSKPTPGMIDSPWTKRLKFLTSLPGFQCIPEYHVPVTSPICF